MPNWCTTSLEVSGDAGELDKFLSQIRKTETEYGQKIDIIDALYPCPQELVDTVSGWSGDEAVQAEREKQYEANMAKYGYKDWYDWQYSVWGTKWGDCNTSIDEPYVRIDNKKVVDIHFQTAWGPATGAWIHISKMFPGLTFDFYHDEEAGFFEGYEVIRGGEIVAESQYAPCEYKEELDWDDDESMDEYFQWKNTMRKKCYEEKQAIMKALDG